MGRCGGGEVEVGRWGGGRWGGGKVGRWESGKVEHFGSSHFLLELFLVLWAEQFFLFDCASHGSQQMGSRGQFTRSSVAHHHSGTAHLIPRDRHRRSAVHKLLSPQPRRAIIHSGGGQCIGGRPRSCSVGNFARGVARAPSTHVQAEPGKSPDARVAEAQASVSRLQAALDLLGAEGIS